MNMLSTEGKTLVGFFWTCINENDLKKEAELI